MPIKKTRSAAARRKPPATIHRRRCEGNFQRENLRGSTALGIRSGTRVSLIVCGPNRILHPRSLGQHPWAGLTIFYYRDKLSILGGIGCCVLVLVTIRTLRAP